MMPLPAAWVRSLLSMALAVPACAAIYAKAGPERLGVLIYLSFPFLMAITQRAAAAAWLVHRRVDLVELLLPRWGRSFWPALVGAGALGVWLSTAHMVEPLWAAFCLGLSVWASYAAAKAGCVLQGCCRGQLRLGRNRLQLNLPAFESLASLAVFTLLLVELSRASAPPLLAATAASFFLLRLISMRLRS